MSSIAHQLEKKAVALLRDCGVKPPAAEQTDAQMLDRLLATATERPKEQVSHGVVYTGCREAAFMCRIALAECLSNRTGRESAEIAKSLESEVIDGGLRAALDYISILDPACGAGAFLVEMYDLLRRITHWPPAKILNHLYGADSDQLAIRAARIRLLLRSGADADLRLALVDSLNPTAFSRKFDVVIGNPPYVRQEMISDPFQPDGKRDYKRTVRQWMTERHPGTVISGRSDLCLYFFLRALSLLASDGICCLITTSSWLDAEFGLSLRRTLAEKFDLRLVMEDQASRAFPNADVNPVIALVSAGKLSGETRFVSIEASDFRISGEDSGRRVSSEQLLRWPHKWGSLHLRASPLALELIESGLLAPLGKHPLVKKIGRGIRTGRDSFFCLRTEQARQLGIEPDYLHSLIKSPIQFLHKPPVVQEDSEWLLFVCRRVRESLSQDTGALRYIQQEELRLHRPCAGWWALDHYEPAEILLPVGFGERLFVVSNPALAAAHQRFATLYPKESAGPVLLALLRCSLTLYFVELFGRRTLGQGALDIPPADWRAVYAPIIDVSAAGEIIKASEALYLRPCGPIWSEMKSEDQMLLDSAVAEAMGIEESILASIRKELLSLVERRLARVRVAKR